MPQFDPDTDAGDYASQIAFYTLQAHAGMNEFSSVHFGGHGLLGNTFIRFLAKQSGNTSSVVKLEKKLEEFMKKINKKLDKTVAAAKKAKGWLPAGASGDSSRVASTIATHVLSEESPPTSTTPNHFAPSASPTLTERG